MAEALLVGAIPHFQRPPRDLRGGPHARLLAVGPLLPRPLADAQVGGERLQPLVPRQLPPRPLGGGVDGRVVGEGAGGQHPLDPAGGAAAARQRRPGLRLGKRIEMGCQRLGHSTGTGRPHSRSRATPPSGKILSRTCVTGRRAAVGTGKRWRRFGPRRVRGSSSRHVASSGTAALSAPSRRQLSG